MSGSTGSGGRGGAKGRRSARVSGTRKGVAGVVMSGFGKMAGRGGSQRRGFIYKF